MPPNRASCAIPYLPCPINVCKTFSDPFPCRVFILFLTFCFAFVAISKSRYHRFNSLSLELPSWMTGPHTLHRFRLSLVPRALTTVYLLVVFWNFSFQLMSILFFSFLGGFLLCIFLESYPPKWAFLYSASVAFPFSFAALTCYRPPALLVLACAGPFLPIRWPSTYRACQLFCIPEALFTSPPPQPCSYHNELSPFAPTENGSGFPFFRSAFDPLADLCSRVFCVSQHPAPTFDLFSAEYFSFFSW